ncbi:MAG: D-sedoheptulose 7-phosphate isomerase [Thermoguttaceae bacterium]|nr:D-sedoheptulose 7-phosphate isomerase [Thermoguttaceae bacterium]
MDIAREFGMITDAFSQLHELSPQIGRMIDLWIESLKNEKKIMFCGNGGSASQSQHLAAELVGRYKIDRPAMNSISLTVDTSVLTAVGNDYGYDDVFRRQVEGLGKPGDVLVGLSTSGNSKNIVLAFEQARKQGIVTIALTGRNRCRMSELADLTLSVPATASNSIQEMHLMIGHFVCGKVESFFYGK